MDRFDAVRDEFPALRRWVYLNIASRCPLPSYAVRVLNTYHEECAANGGNKAGWLEKAELVRERYARFIGARPEEIAYTRNVTEALNIMVHGLRPAGGDNVVLVPDLEHPTAAYSFSHLRESGVELRFVGSPDGRYDTERIVERIDESTLLVFLSAVSYLTGARADLYRISKRCAETGAVLLVDSAQAVGVLDVDVTELGIDALAGSAQKGLLGVYGIGFLYCRQDLADEIDPVFLSRAGVLLPGEREYVRGDILRYQVAPGARRFELGNYNYGAIHAVEKSLEFLAGLGMSDVERRVLGTAGALITGLTDLGIEVITPANPGDRAGIVSMRTADPARVTERLHEAGIIAAARSDAVRFSLHLYNNANDVDRVVSTVRALHREGYWRMG